jgi:hypothetical protein
MKYILLFYLLITIRFSYCQQPIFATIYGGDLYKIDIVNCSRQFVGSTNHIFGDIAFTPDGRLWGIEFGNLYQIDTITAESFLIGYTGQSSVSLVALNDSILFAESDANLYAINISDASSYFIDSIHYVSTGDLTWYDRDLYMTAGGSLIKMVFDPAYTDILAVSEVNSPDNPIPVCAGTATASFEANYNSIIGFEGPDLYKICQLDGSSILICPFVNEGGTTGAASIKLAIQDPEPTTCEKIPDEIIAFDDMFQLYPNPCTDFITVCSNKNLTNSIIQIKNSFGEIVISDQLNVFHDNDGNEIYLGPIPTGMYFINIILESETFTKTVIKI